MGLRNKAEALARELHAGAVRRGTDIPYITHPEAVASKVDFYGGGEELVAAAWLHDVVEDCGREKALEKVRAACGDRVAELVMEVTHDAGINKAAFVAHLSRASDEGALIAACDKYHNMHCIILAHGEVGEPVWDRFKGGRPKVIEYYTMVVPMLAWKLGRTHKIHGALLGMLDILASLP